MNCTEAEEDDEIEEEEEKKKNISSHPWEELTTSFS